jgi:MtN3 and saliva related transmembrane protein
MRCVPRMTKRVPPSRSDYHPVADGAASDLKRPGPEEEKAGTTTLNRTTTERPSLAVTALGFIAGTMTTLAFLPQVIRSYRNGATHLSWWWLVLFACGVATWTCYGVLRADAAIIWTNGVTLLLVLSLIVLRARPR